MSSFLLMKFILMISLLQISYTTIPNGCGEFQYFAPSFNKSNPASIINSSFQKVDKYLEYLYKINNIPSISFGIVYDDELIHYKSFGFTDLNNRRNRWNKPNKHSIYRIASITKSFTVLMAYLLRDAGQISFDDTIYKLNNNFSIHNPWGITRKEQMGQTLTIQQLASQISGLPREAPCNVSDDCIGITTNEIFTKLSQLYLIHATDVQSSYSNLAYAILGNVLSEYIGDESYEETLHELIFDPLQMDHSGLYLTDDQTSFAVKGYDTSFNEQEWIDISWNAPAGQIFSSVYDLALFIKQFLVSYPSRFEQGISSTKYEHNFLTQPQTFREMLRPVFMNPDKESAFGASWEMQILKNHWLRGKSGNINGFSSNIQIVPEMKLGVIALINTQIDATKFTLGPLEILIPAFEKWMSLKEIDYSANYGQLDITKYVGKYYNIQNNVEMFEIFIDLPTNNLILSSNSQRLYGILIWKREFEEKKTNDINDNINTTKMIYNELQYDTKSCWVKTASMASDGMIIDFISDENNGNIKNAKIMQQIIYGTIYLERKDE